MEHPSIYIGIYPNPLSPLSPVMIGILSFGVISTSSRSLHTKPLQAHVLSLQFAWPLLNQWRSWVDFPQNHPMRVPPSDDWLQDSELPRVPSLRTLLKFPDEDENQVAGVLNTPTQLLHGGNRNANNWNTWEGSLGVVILMCLWILFEELQQDCFYNFSFSDYEASSDILGYGGPKVCCSVSFICCGRRGDFCGTFSDLSPGKRFFL